MRKNYPIYIFIFCLSVVCFVLDSIAILNNTQTVTSTSSGINLTWVRIGYYYFENSNLYFSTWGAASATLDTIILISGIFILGYEIKQRKTIFKNKISRLFFIPFIVFTFLLTTILICDLPRKYEVLNQTGGLYFSYNNIFGFYELNQNLEYVYYFSSIGMFWAIIALLLFIYEIKVGIVLIYEIHIKFGKKYVDFENDVKNVKLTMHLNNSYKNLCILDLFINILICTSIFILIYYTGEGFIFANGVSNARIEMDIFFVCYWLVIFAVDIFFFFFIRKNIKKNNWYKWSSYSMIIFGGIFLVTGGTKILTKNYEYNEKK